VGVDALFFSENSHLTATKVNSATGACICTAAQYVKHLQRQRQQHPRKNSKSAVGRPQILGAWCFYRYLSWSSRDAVQRPAVFAGRAAQVE
jgi:hypothetical protein